LFHTDRRDHLTQAMIYLQHRERRKNAKAITENVGIGKYWQSLFNIEQESLILLQLVLFRRKPTLFFMKASSIV
jgi:hypothetical protein